MKNFLHDNQLTLTTDSKTVCETEEFAVKIMNEPAGHDYALKSGRKLLYHGIRVINFMILYQFMSKYY